MFHQTKMVKHILGVGTLTILMLALTACGEGSSAQKELEQTHKVEERTHKVEEQTHKVRKEEEQAPEIYHLLDLPEGYEAQPILAGRYVTEEFRPTMSFRLGKGWASNTELPDAWDIKDVRNPRWQLEVASPEEVYDHRPDPSNDVVGGEPIMPAPKDIVGWLQADPYLKTKAPTTTSVGNEKGVQFDALVVGNPGHRFLGCDGCQDLGLFYSEGYIPASRVDNGEKLRFIVLEDVKGQTVVIFVEAPAASFNEFLPKAQRVIKTIEWKGT